MEAKVKRAFISQAENNKLYKEGETWKGTQKEFDELNEAGKKTAYRGALLEVKEEARAAKSEAKAEAKSAKAEAKELKAGTETKELKPGTETK